VGAGSAANERTRERERRTRRFGHIGLGNGPALLPIYFGPKSLSTNRRIRLLPEKSSEDRRKAHPGPIGRTDRFFENNTNLQTQRILHNCSTMVIRAHKPNDFSEKRSTYINF
jgi:hypothetical protein